MNKEDFKIAENTRKLIMNIFKNYENCPKRFLEIKKKLESTSIELLECVYNANYTKNKEDKEKYYKLCTSKLKVLDFLINYSSELNMINTKTLSKFSKNLEEITKMLIGWKNYFKLN